MYDMVLASLCAGLSTKCSPVQYEVLISIAQVPELQCVEVKDGGVEIGAAVTVARIVKELEKLRKSLPGAQHQFWLVFATLPHLSILVYSFMAFFPYHFDYFHVLSFIYHIWAGVIYTSSICSCAQRLSHLDWCYYSYPIYATS